MTVDAVETAVTAAVLAAGIQAKLTILERDSIAQAIELKTLRREVDEFKHGLSFLQWAGATLIAVLAAIAAIKALFWGVP